MVKFRGCSGLFTIFKFTPYKESVNQPLNLHPRIKILISCLFLLSVLNSVHAQPEIPSKLSPLITNIYKNHDSLQHLSYQVLVTDSLSFILFLERNKIPVRNLQFYQSANIFSLELNPSDINKHLLQSDIVRFIEKKRKPVEEMNVNGFDLGANKISKLHHEYPLWNGSGMIVSVKEQRPDTADIDFRGRYISTPLQSLSTTTHATLMTNMIAGGGNSFYTGKGVAWGSAITSSDFSSLLPDPDTYYQQYNISVQNHSYGTGVENYYGADAMAYDISTINNPELIHVFSAGNMGTTAPSIGMYQDIEGYANLTGSFKMAKNILTVGAIDPFIQIPLQSSRGPAYDGRIKPELVAFGVDGSSGSAAVVSGISLILQQVYKSLHQDSLPSSALVKAVLLNSADDIGPQHPDFISGYGNANGFKAIQLLTIGNFIKDKLIEGEEMIYPLQVPYGIRQMKLTLVWNDVPAEVNSPRALVNDLDLQLNAGAQSWQPWVLNHFPRKDSLQLPAERKRDSLNNVEQITLDFPEPGNYTFSVKGKKIPGSPQEFYLAYQFDTVNVFTWHYPVYRQNIFPGNNNIIRWESGFDKNKTGKLEYSLNGSDWQLVNSNVDLSKSFYNWQASDTISLAHLRMQIDGIIFVSDTFTISKDIKLLVGFHCKDSVLLYWENVEEATGYQIYSLENNYLEPVIITNDTSIVISKSNYTSLHYSVAPIIGSMPAIKSFTINYTQQGVECYFRSFLAGIMDDDIHLQLSLGSLYNIITIDWEKLTPTGYQVMYREPIITQTSLNYIDVAPTGGVNIYRVKLTLRNGQIIYSDSITIYFADVNKYRVYPNPVGQYHPVHIISREADIASMQVFNSMGILMLEKRLDDVINTIPAGMLSKGLYIIRVISDDGMITHLKLVVL